MATLDIFGIFGAFRGVFRKSYLASTTQSLDVTVGTGIHADFDVFSTWAARRTRYRLYWAYYENSAYDSVHQWAAQYKKEYSLYRATRGTYNPFNRLGEFWASHLWGGTLDSTAGDGKGVPSALPIVTKNDRLRPAIAKLWRDSNWQVNKDVASRMGSIMGDVGIRVVDDADLGEVRLEIVDPDTLPWVRLDRQGNVKSNIIQELELDPDYDPREPVENVLMERACWYREEVFRDGDHITYSTFKNGEPYHWPGNPGAEWSEPYGFVPMVLIQHQKISSKNHWGLSEFHAALPKAREVDDLGSNLHDQIRKAVWPKWLFTGIQDPSLSNRSTRFRRSSNGSGQSQSCDTDQDGDHPHSGGREEVGAIFASSGATAYPLLFPLDTQFASQEIQNQIASLEEDYPELQMDSRRVAGDASGKALIEARRKVEAKVHARRANYDDALVRAMQMAIAIAGWRGYEGYEGFGLDSYGKGDLDMRIGQREVFALDPQDVIDRETAFWTAAGIAVKQAGCPIEVFLERNGWTAAQITDFTTKRDAEAERALALMAKAQPATSSAKE